MLFLIPCLFPDFYEDQQKEPSTCPVQVSLQASQGFVPPVPALPPIEKADVR